MFSDRRKAVRVSGLLIVLGAVGTERERQRMFCYIIHNLMKDALLTIDFPFSAVGASNKCRSVFL